MTKHIKLFTVILMLFAVGCINNPSYDIHGATFEFEEEEIVEPEWRTRLEVERVAGLFGPYLENKYKPLDGVHFYIMKDRPTILVGALDEETGKFKTWNEPKCGVTYPKAKYSAVYHREFLSDGCGMWELRLHFMQFLFPGQSEIKDLEWMQKEGIV